MVHGFSVVRGEVKFDAFGLVLGGMEFCAAMGWGIFCECHYMLVSNIFGIGDSILPIRYCLGAQSFLPDLPHSFPHVFDRSTCMCRQ